MLKRIYLLLFLTFASTGLHAAPIDWVVGDIDGPTGLGDQSVSTNGTLIEAANFGTASPPNPTINSVTFIDIDFPNAQIPTNLTGLSYNLNQSGGGATGIGDIDSLLDTISFRRSDSLHEASLTGLTPGDIYEVQFFLSFDINRTYSFDDEAGNVVALSARNPAQFVTGTFIADATTQAITLRSSTGSHVLNGYQLRMTGQATIVTTLIDELDSNSSDGAGISLREALRDIEEGESVLFASSLNGETIQLDAALGELIIDKSLAIDASSLPNGVIIDGGSNGDLTQDPDEVRCLFITDGDNENDLAVTLENLTFQNGSTTSQGGNINNQENLTLRDCRILNGRARSFGGGIRSQSATLSMERCLLSGNESDSVGGGVSTFSGALIMSDCTISDNRALEGGGISAGRGETTLTRCTLSGNVANFRGGGVNFGAAVARLSFCTLSGNRADSGGAFSTASSSDVSTECHFTHCTIVGNRAETTGGGFFFRSIARANSASFTATIVRDNDGGDLETSVSGGSFTITSRDGQNLIGTGNDLSAFSATEISNEPILLAPLANYGGLTETMPPLLGSPAIDAAVTSEATQDQRGFGIRNGGDSPVELLLSPALNAPSPTGSLIIVATPDIGAAEFQGEFRELELAFDTDGDKDGLPVGLELFLGSEPFVADFDNPNRPRLEIINSAPVLTFGRASNSFFTEVIVERSETLLPGSFGQIAFIDPFSGNTATLIAKGEGENNVDVQINADSVVVTDNIPSGKAFYRLRAVLGGPR